jgi:hypothetical protein
MVQLISNPALNRRATLNFKGLPVDRINESVLIFNLEQVTIPHLARAPSVTLIVKAKENASCHLVSPQPLEFGSNEVSRLNSPCRFCTWITARGSNSLARAIASA